MIITAPFRRSQASDCVQRVKRAMWRYETEAFPKLRYRKAGDYHRVWSQRECDGEIAPLRCEAWTETRALANGGRNPMQRCGR